MWSLPASTNALGSAKTPLPAISPAIKTAAVAALIPIGWMSISLYLNKIQTYSYKKNHFFNL